MTKFDELIHFMDRFIGSKKKKKKRDDYYQMKYLSEGLLLQQKVIL